MANNSNQDEYNKALQNLLTLSGKKVEIKKVWLNASATSAFKGQDIDVDIQDADFVVITSRYSTNSSTFETFIFDPAEGGYLRELAGAGYANVGYQSRYVEFASEKITFGDNYYKNINTATTGTINNIYQIPVAIYTVKGVI